MSRLKWMLKLISDVTHGVHRTLIFVETVKQCVARCVAPKYRSLMVTVLRTLMKMYMDDSTNIEVRCTF
jgi:hypothetical protein